MMERKGNIAIRQTEDFTNWLLDWETAFWRARLRSASRLPGSRGQCLVRVPIASPNAFPVEKCGTHAGISRAWSFYILACRNPDGTDHRAFVVCWDGPSAREIS